MTVVFPDPGTVRGDVNARIMQRTPRRTTFQLAIRIINYARGARRCAKTVKGQLLLGIDLPSSLLPPSFSSIRGNRVSPIACGVDREWKMPDG